MPASSRTNSVVCPAARRRRPRRARRPPAPGSRTAGAVARAMRTFGRARRRIQRPHGRACRRALSAARERSATAIVVHAGPCCVRINHGTPRGSTRSLLLRAAGVVRDRGARTRTTRAASAAERESDRSRRRRQSRSRSSARGRECIAGVIAARPREYRGGAGETGGIADTVRPSIRPCWARVTSGAAARCSASRAAAASACRQRRRARRRSRPRRAADPRRGRGGGEDPLAEAAQSRADQRVCATARIVQRRRERQSIRSAPRARRRSSDPAPAAQARDSSPSADVESPDNRRAGSSATRDGSARSR